MNSFQRKLLEHGLDLRRAKLEALQINVGRKCNQACRHCHVDAAPWRTEMMSLETATRVIDWIVRHRPAVVDITGGAPELHPQFRDLVLAGRLAGARVIDRNNLTILEEPGFESLHELLAAQQVEIIASLPCYSAVNVARQRGNGVFETSIRALQKLNKAGYGASIPLHLVYNPVGPALPPPQQELEGEYKEVLGREFGIVFHRLLAITNQPIARFAADLQDRGTLTRYFELLEENFNSTTVPGLMCRTLLSVGHRGEIYDCDFNQMLGMQIQNGKPLHLWDIDPGAISSRPIQTGAHCLACTAGCGSSCGGALA